MSENTLHLSEKVSPMITGTEQWFLVLSLVASFASILGSIGIAFAAFKIFGFWRTQFKMIIIGPTGVGKTSLTRMLVNKIPHKSHVRTDGHSDTFNVFYRLGVFDGRVFAASVVREVGGEFSNLIQRHLKVINPDAMVIMVDGRNASEEQQVLYEFCKSINQFFAEDSSARSNLNSILIIINKYDAISQFSVNEIHAKFKEKNKSFYDFLSNKLPNVHVMTCCGSLVEPQFYEGVREGLRALAQTTRRNRDD